MGLLSTILGAAVRGLFANASDSAGTILNNTLPELPPDDSHLAWSGEVANKVMRLDDAVELLHLMAALVGVRGIAATLREKLDKLLSELSSEVVERIATKGGLKKTLAVVDQFVSALENSTLELKKQGQIRKAAKSARLDVRAHYLRPKRGQIRKVAIVHSRHKTDPQRAPNKLWHAPSKRN